MIILTILKFLLVIGFLIYFWRRPSLLAGVGLLTVTTAVLLDTFLGTFNREQMLADLGFFYYIIVGFLISGAAIWLLGVLRPVLGDVLPVASTTAVAPTTPLAQRARAATASNSEGGFDRQMLADQIRQRLSPDDILDLIFDIELNENDVLTLHQTMDDIITNVLDTAAAQAQTPQLALAVERILTPPPPENLPRVEKIDAGSPPTILRHYLLGTHSFDQLQALATQLGIDWEQLDRHNKKTFTRNLLLHLYRRNNIHELIDLLHAASAPDATAVGSA